MNQAPLIRTLSAHPVSCMALMESLSQIELAGAQWIMCIPHPFWRADRVEEFLVHAGDEIRHSRIMADAALQIRCALPPESREAADTLSQIGHRATAHYLRSLFGRAARLLGRGMGRTVEDARPFHLYLVLSLLVERRLMTIYPHLAKVGFSAQARTAAARLIQDERRHLSSIQRGIQSMESDASFPGKLGDLYSVEEPLAEAWLGNLSKDNAYGSQENENRAGVSRVGLALSGFQDPALA